MAVAHIGGFLFVTYDCLKHRREADSALLWIFVSYFIPLGFLLYLYMGIDRVPDPVMAYRKSRSEQHLDEHLRGLKVTANWAQVHGTSVCAPTSRFGIALERAFNALLPDSPLMGGNSVEPLICGDEAYPLMLDAIDKAQNHVHLQSFIIGNDDISRQFLDRLVAKARQGVKVCVLYDRFGSTHAVLHGFFRKYRNIPNMRVVGFTQANILKRQFAINLRNHRKIMVVDGNTAFTGGTNIAAENMTRPEAPPPIHDYHFEIRGPVVHELQYTFLRDWFGMTQDSPKSLFTEDNFPDIASCGEAQVRVINSGPTSTLRAISDAYFMSITNARSQILAVTPYFVPSLDIIHGLKAAALRGVDVRIIVPRENNHFYAGLASRGLYEEMLEAGVRVFEREPPFAHAKALLVDDTYALVGSANMDVRSLRLNYETCIGIYGETYINKMKAIVLHDQSVSSEVELGQWQRRPQARKLLENAALLMTPVL